MELFPTHNVTQEARKARKHCLTNISDRNVWRTASGAHHANAASGKDAEGIDVDFDSAAFAKIWNTGWRDRDDLPGRVVVGFGVGSREEVDRLYGEMTNAGYRGLQPPWDAFWGARYAVIEDPDGLAVGLMSPVSVEHRAPPPQV
jgi:hypothetical protein